MRSCVRACVRACVRVYVCVCVCVCECECVCDRPAEFQKFLFVKNATVRNSLLNTVVLCFQPRRTED